MTRSDIQGFIDGYLKGGGDAKKIRNELANWMAKHPVYPQDEAAQAIILNDLESYRGVQL